jgi:uncharacterized membrane protein
MFRPQNWLDRVFEIGIIGKGLNGALEIVGGLLLLFLTPARIHHVLAALTQGELSEDPGDFIATRLLHTANGLTGSAVLFGAAYLLIHGLVKVALVTALLANKLWAYPWTIAVLLLFISYQLYRIALSPTAGLIALTLFDAVIVALTWREYRQQRGIRAAPPTASPTSAAHSGSGPRDPIQVSARGTASDQYGDATRHQSAGVTTEGGRA